MPSTRRPRGRGAYRCARRLVAPLCFLGLFAGLLAIGVGGMGPVQAQADPPQTLPPHFPPQPSQTPNWPPPNWPPPHGDPAPPPPDSPPPSGGGGSSSQTPSGGVEGAVGTSRNGT